MLVNIFTKLTDYASFRRLLWKPVYELLAKKFKVRDWSLMNFGYAPSPNEPPLILHPSDEINRFPIQLYHYAAIKAEVQGKIILEVGSGRGGGAAYIKKYLQPQSITGVDIAMNAVKRANDYFGGNGIDFVQGNAEKLPFSNDSFDVVINIESSHTYGSMQQFLAEVKRVLRSGGYLLLADIRTSKDGNILKEHIQASGMQLISEEDISENIVRAIEGEEPVKQKRIKEHVPLWLQKVFKEFAGITGSKVHIDLKSGALVYYRFVLKKL
jgi:ubiquinone/menaquinone biosynthesis C-methylase UbiE